MRIIGVVGSIRRGNTYAMVEAACNSLEEYEVELFHLKEAKIHMCDGCLSCDESGICHIKDTMSDILPRMLQADGFIFGTPSRWGLLSGELKVFFDRLNPFAASEKLKGKKAVIFAVGQTENGDAKSIKTAANSIHIFCESAGIEVVDTVLAKDCLDADSLITKHPDFLDKCKKAVIKLRKSIISKC
jgi:multimeric flavodoxin WrbA